MFDRPVEFGPVIIPFLTEPDEVLAGLGNIFAVQFQVQRPRVGHESHVGLLFHPGVTHHVVFQDRGFVLFNSRHRRGRERCGDL